MLHPNQVNIGLIESYYSYVCNATFHFSQSNDFAWNCSLMHFPCPSLSLAPVLAKKQLILVLLYFFHFHLDLQKYFPELFCDFKHILAGPATSLLVLVLAYVGTEGMNRSSGSSARQFKTIFSLLVDFTMFGICSCYICHIHI